MFSKHWESHLGLLAFKLSIIVYFTIHSATLAQYGPGGVGTVDGSSNLRLWIAPDSGLMATGGKVVRWQDISGSGNDVTQSTAECQPSLTPGGLSGFPTVRFDGAGICLQRKAGNITAPKGFTAILAVRPFQPQWNNSIQTLISQRGYPSNEEFESTSLWEALDLQRETINGVTDLKGYIGGVFDGRYVYFTPYYDTPWPARHGRMLRYDTHGTFKSSTSWEAVDLSSVTVDGVGDLRGYEGGAFDGRYVYFSPCYDGLDYHGKMLRYDTHLPFTVPSSWQAIDMAAHTIDRVSNLRGFLGAIFDGRFVYYVPFTDSDGRHGRMLRYDTQLPFQSPASWQAYDIGSQTIDGVSGLHGFYGGVFDGRYLYFVPCYDDNGLRHGRMLRYDTQEIFNSAGSWEAIDMGDQVVDGVTNFKGFMGGGFDGRYIYYASFYDGTDSHGRMIRFDTKGPFRSLKSWQAIDLTSQVVDGVTNLFGHSGVVFDGRYVYYAPWGVGNPGGASGRMLRFDTNGEFGALSSWSAIDLATKTIDGVTGLAGFEGNIFDGRYIYYVPTGLGEYHGKFVRFDTFRNESAFALNYSMGGNGIGNSPMTMQSEAGIAGGGLRVATYNGQSQPSLGGALHIVSTSYDTKTMSLFVDHLQVGKSDYSSQGLIMSSSSQLTIGGSQTGETGFQGDMLEVAFFSEPLNAAQRTLVENAMASKYRLGELQTLFPIDSSTEQFSQAIAGIGREDDGVNAAGSSDGMMLADNGTNPYLQHTGDYAVAGHNAGATLLAPISTSHCTGRWTRVWKLRFQRGVTSVGGLINISFDFRKAGRLEQPHGEYFLLRSSDNGDHWEEVNATCTIVGSSVMFRGIAEGQGSGTLSDGDVVTLGGPTLYPVIELGSSDVAFPYCESHARQYDTLLVTNTSSNPLNVDSIYVGTPQFGVSQATALLDFVDTLRVAVSFFGPAPLRYTDTLYIKNNSLVPLVKVPLSGISIGPSIVSFPDTNAQEDSIYNYSIRFTHPDSAAPLSTTKFHLVIRPTWLNLDAVGGGVRGIPEMRDVGDTTVSIEACDLWGSVARQTFRVHVHHVNHVPEFVSRPDTVAREDSMYTYQVLTEDRDSALFHDGVRLQAPTLPTWLNFDSAKCVLFGVPNIHNLGDTVVVLAAIDGNGGYTRQRFSITVLHVDHAPRFAMHPVTTAQEDSLYFYQMHPTDPDTLLGQRMWTDLQNAPAWMKADSVHWRIFGVPREDDIGTTSVTVRLTDSDGKCYFRSYNVTVVPHNHAPVISRIADVVFPDDSSAAVRLDPYVRDREDSVSSLHWAATIVEPGMQTTLSERAGDSSARQNHSPRKIFNCSPASKGTRGIGDSLTVTIDSATHTAIFRSVHQFRCMNIPVILEVTDPGGLSARDTLFVTVQHIKRAPSFVGMPDTLAAENVAYRSRVRAVNVDPTDSTIVFAIVGPCWMHADSLGNMWGTPERPGVCSVRIIARNSEAVSDTLRLDFPVLSHESWVNRVNGPPHSFVLNQNYPNPFNPSTTIQFALPERSRVTLSVFNMLGQLVATILSGYMESGYHELQWAPSGLASGVYFLLLDADASSAMTHHFRSVRKMALVR